MHTIDDKTSPAFAPEIVTAIKDLSRAEHGAVKVSGGGLDVFIESLVKPPAVILFGAGHLAGYIARFAAAVHFRVIVCDGRAEYANRKRFPEADEIMVEDFSRVFENVEIDADSYLVIVTRGHMHGLVVDLPYGRWAREPLMLGRLVHG